MFLRGTGAEAGVDSAWEQEKLEARKMLDAKRAAESPASSARTKMGSSFYTRETRVQPAKVYSEAASTQAEQSSGERLVRLPRCTVVFGQIDLNTGGEWATPMRKLIPQSDRAC